MDIYNLIKEYTLDNFLLIYFLGSIPVIQRIYKNVLFPKKLLKSNIDTLYKIRNMSFKHQLIKTNSDYVHEFLNLRDKAEENYQGHLALLKDTPPSLPIFPTNCLQELMTALRKYCDAREFNTLINFEEEETRNIIQDSYNKVECITNVTLGKYPELYKKYLARFLPFFIYRNFIDFLELVFEISTKVKINQENQIVKGINFLSALLGALVSVIEGIKYLSAL